MSAPVDVLRPYARDTGAFRVSNKGAAEIAEALAAFYELIEAAKNARSWIDGCGAQAGSDAVLMEIDAALARVQGGAA